jgi:hypothetical protein
LNGARTAGVFGEGGKDALAHGNTVRVFGQFTTTTSHPGRHTIVTFPINPASFWASYAPWITECSSAINIGFMFRH